MPIVDVTLNHRVYPVACEEGQEDRVRNVARFLQQQVKEVRNQAPGATDAHLLVMVCLMLADELTDSRGKPSGPGREPASSDDGETEAMAAMVATLAERIETIAQRLEQA